MGLPTVRQLQLQRPIHSGTAPTTT